MNEKNIRRASLDEIAEMDRRGELYHNPHAPEGPSLGEDFWKDAVLMPAPPHNTIVLPVKREVMQWFKDEHPDYVRRMNEILSDHMQAVMRKKAG